MDISTYISSLLTLTPTSVTLTGPNNWDEWYTVIQALAITHKVWDFVNPEVTTPESVAEEEYGPIQIAMDWFPLWILDSTEQSIISSYLHGCETPREMLAALKKHFTSPQALPLQALPEALPLQTLSTDLTDVTDLDSNSVTDSDSDMDSDMNLVTDLVTDSDTDLATDMDLTDSASTDLTDLTDSTDLMGLTDLMDLTDLADYGIGIQIFAPPLLLADQRPASTTDPPTARPTAHPPTGYLTLRPPTACLQTCTISHLNPRSSLKLRGCVDREWERPVLARCC